MACAAQRPVRLLAAGGTIAMRGEAGAVPALDGRGLSERLGLEVESETMFALPSAHLSLDQGLALARRAAELAAAGAGVVLTTGTDTMEELAVLCSLLHGGEAPIVLTGANRPDSAPGADGPANLADAVALAASPAGAGLGAVVVFAGEIHAGMSVRKLDSTGPGAFGSPQAGPLGRVLEGRVWLHARPLRPPTLAPRQLDLHVPILTASLGDEGAPLAAATRGAHGAVLVAFGAGHLSPAQLRELRAALERIPVALTCRPERSAMLFSTYGFEGAERDLRASGAVIVPFLSPPAARMALLACLGAGLDLPAIRSTLAPWDAC
jgi:L-asparaginase